MTLAAKTDEEALPPALAQKLAQQAQAYFAPGAPQPGPPTWARRAARRRRSGVLAELLAFGGVAGWLAAAACLVLALFGWLRTVPGGEPVVQNVPEVPVPPVVAPVVTANTGRRTCGAHGQSRFVENYLERDQGSCRPRRERRCGVGS